MAKIVLSGPDGETLVRFNRVAGLPSGQGYVHISGPLERALWSSFLTFSRSIYLPELGIFTSTRRVDVWTWVYVAVQDFVRSTMDTELVDVRPPAGMAVVQPPESDQERVY